MTILERVIDVLFRHREARRWADEAVAADVLAALGIDPAAEHGGAETALPPHGGKGIVTDPDVPPSPSMIEAVEAAPAERLVTEVAAPIAPVAPIEPAAQVEPVVVPIAEPVAQPDIAPVIEPVADAVVLPAAEPVAGA